MRHALLEKLQGIWGFSVNLIKTSIYILDNTASLTSPHEWMEKDYQERTEMKILYGILEDNKIVSVTDSEMIPNKPEKMIHIGIDTLQQYRRKGYASLACAAFIENHLRRGLMPVWECGINNTASRNLAEKLGFRHLGNTFFAATLDKSLLSLW